MENRTSSRKTRVGLVVSDKMDKTVVVAIADRVAHPLYKKIVKRTYKLKAHDEEVVALNERLETLIDEMSNTRSIPLLTALNNYPVIAVLHVRTVLELYGNFLHAFARISRKMLE